MTDTHLASTLSVLENTDRIKYDDCIKEVLADKQILARILKYTMQEFQDMEISEIIQNMTNPEVSKCRAEPSWSNYTRVERTSEESKVPNEGAIYYDIRFSVYHGQIPIKYLINIEAQNSTKKSQLGYQIDNRMIYYSCRMISSQLESEFSDSNYDELKPVRSIWICLDGKIKKDSINRIYLNQSSVFGNPMTFKNLHKLEIIVVQLRKSKNAKKSKNKLIAMLEEIIKKDDFIHKKQILHEEYGLIMEVETERRIKNMCNWSEVLLGEALEEGYEKGIQQTFILCTKLAESNRQEDIKRAMVDENYRTALFAEFNL